MQTLQQVIDMCGGNAEMRMALLADECLGECARWWLVAPDATYTNWSAAPTGLAVRTAHALDNAR